MQLDLTAIDIKLENLTNKTYHQAKFGSCYIALVALQYILL